MNDFKHYYENYRRLIITGGVVAVFWSLALSYGFLGVHNRWWFEDDPMMVSRASELINPLAPFIDPAVLRDYGASNAMAPMQVLTFWIDWQIAGPNPAFYYFHTNTSAALVAGLLFIVFSLVLQRVGWALFLTGLWTLLPSTLALNQFVSARHYIEGMLFFLAAVVMLLLGKDSKKSGQILIVGLCILSMLTKETWALTTLTFLFLWGAARRQKFWIGTSIVLAIAYFSYRMFLIGVSLQYQAKPASAFDYWQFIGILPYVFTGNRGGFLVLLLSVLGLGWILRGQNQESRSLLLRATFVVLVVAPSILALYPVSYSLLVTYIAPTTWYRVFSTINVAALILLGLVLTASLPRSLKVTLSLILFLSISYGALKTRQWWYDRSAGLAVEGQFFVAHADKIVYSEDEAFWYLSGLGKLYRLGERPFLNPHHPEFGSTLMTLAKEKKNNPARFDTVYVRDNLSMVPSPDRFNFLFNTPPQ